eukprot:1159862-Pelagomonas_calceolata.AAC.3
MEQSQWSKSADQSLWRMEQQKSIRGAVERSQLSSISGVVTIEQLQSQRSIEAVALGRHGGAVTMGQQWSSKGALKRSQWSSHSGAVIVEH